MSEINEPHLLFAIARYQYTSRAVPTLGYIGQLVSPPPKGIKILSMDACIKILRFPSKSLGYNSAHELHLLRGPNMTRIDTYLESCMARAAYKAIFCNEQQGTPPVGEYGYSL